jgi:molybdopterin-guanine dinucleotide biosynthesis protein A
VRVARVPEADLEQIDPGLRSFFNTNTPEDLERARRLAKG